MLAAHAPVLIAILVAVAVASIAVAPRVHTADGFFRGCSESGRIPGVVTLTLSQVTTWIFARSLLNAGILGYSFGISGALAYTAYYGSFLTGWLVVDHLRFRHGVDNIQAFLRARFGRAGTAAFNLLAALRLLSEVFANLLVVGIVFGVAGSGGHTTAILAVAGVTLVYSMTGGLRASLRTDVLQMSLLLVILAGLGLAAAGHPLFDAAALLGSSPDWQDPGWVLLAVALLQVWSYPLHDPVMMDRGFIADRETTRRSFLHAFWISSACILTFGLLGVFAGLHAVRGEEMLATLERLLGTPAAIALGVALVISAASTLDSTLSSVAKLVVRDMGWLAGSAGNGRLAMAAFCAAGLGLVFVGPDDLFAAVAVSGTAALFLAPVIVFCIVGDRQVAPWSLWVAVAAATVGALLYFLETSGHGSWLTVLTGLEHKYSQLLVTTLAVLAVGFAAFLAGLRRAPAPAARS